MFSSWETNFLDPFSLIFLLVYFDSYFLISYFFLVLSVIYTTNLPRGDIFLEASPIVSCCNSVNNAKH